MTSSAPHPQPSLRTVDAVAVIVGIVVGAGIFRSPQIVAENTGSTPLFLGAWLLGGLVSLIGALCYAELTTAYPSAGGEYHFLRRAFGRGTSFMFAWSRAVVIQTGSIALLAYVFADYAAELLAGRMGGGAGTVPTAVLAAGAVVLLTGLNAAGIRHGRRAQNTLTIVQVVGLLAVIAAGAWLAITGVPAASAPAVPVEPRGLGPLGLAMVFVLLTYGGWNEAAYLSAEVRGGERGRAMMRALLAGIAVITALYLLANLAYVRALGMDGVAGTPVVAAALLRTAVGEWGAALLSIIVAISALCSANATILTGARSNYALGTDFTALRMLGAWSARGGTPVNALLVQCAIALLLVVFGGLARHGFEAMVAYTAPVFWFFLALVGASVIVLRRRDPNRPRPFRIPLYPITPLFFMAVAVLMMYSSLRYAGAGAVLGVIVMMLGLPLLLVAGGPASTEARRSSAA